jgi:TPR repeat protein
MTLVAPAWVEESNPLAPCFAAYEAREYANAATCFRPLAERDNHLAQRWLGLMYADGRGVPQDYVQAVAWYRRAAVQGDAKAQYNLAFLYRKGHGVAQDYGQAVAWYRTAADQGVAEAQYNLGVMYGLGRGVPRNNEAAYVWFSLAAAQGLEGAAKSRDIVASRLTPEALSRAQARAAAEHARLNGGAR